MSVTVTWDELERKHKAGQLKDWAVASFPGVATTAASSSSMTLDKLFSVLIAGSLRSDKPFDGVSMLRTVLQALPASRLNAQVLPDDLLSWLTSFAVDTTSLSTAQRATALSVVVHLLKGCSLKQNNKFLPHIASMVQRNLALVCEAVAAPDAAAGFAANMMALHQVEDIVSILGANHEPEIVRSLASSLPQAVALLRTLGVGRDALQSVHGNQFDLDVAKIFSMLSECVFSLSMPLHDVLGDATAQSDAVHTLLSGAETLVETMLTSELVHDSWLSALHNALALTLLLFPSLAADVQDEVRERLRSLFDALVVRVGESSLDDVVSAKRVELVIGALSSFFDAPHEQSALSVYATVLQSNDDDESAAFDASLLSSLLESMSALQWQMKQRLATATRESGSSAKDFKIVFSDLRKGCISTLDRVFAVDRRWLAGSAARRKVFWELSVKALSTPLLFASAFPALRGQRVFLEQIAAFLHKALAALENYSLTAAEDIVETVKQLVQQECEQVVSVKTAALLRHALLVLPKTLSASDSQAQWKWKTSLCVAMQELYALLLKRVAEREGETDCVGATAEATSLCSLLFREVVVDHVKTSSAFAASHREGQKNKKHKNNKRGGDEDVDGSVDLFHAATGALTACCDLLLNVRKNALADAASLALEDFSWQDGALVCLEGALKPLVFEDDLVDVLLSMELLSRCAALCVADSAARLVENHLVVAALVAIAVVGPVAKSDSDSERLLVTLKLLVEDMLSGKPCDAAVCARVLEVVDSTTVTATQEEHETVLIAAQAATRSLLESVGLSVSVPAENIVNRMQLLKIAVDLLRK